MKSFRYPPEKSASPLAAPGSLRIIAGSLLLLLLFGPGWMWRLASPSGCPVVSTDTGLFSPSPPQIGWVRALSDFGYEQWIETWRGGSSRIERGREGDLDALLARPGEEPAGRRGGAAHPARTGHPLGTDATGRDLLQDVLLGATVYPGACIAAALIALVGGTLVAGGSAFLLRGAAKRTLDLTTDTLAALPRYVVLMVLLGLFRIDLWTVAIPIGILSIPRVSEAIGKKILALREMDFVDAARALGVSRHAILWRHMILASARPVLLTQTVSVMAEVVLIEATLGFLGFGVEGDIRSWGTLVAEGSARKFLGAGIVWPILFPGLAIIASIVAFHAITSGIRARTEEAT